MLRISWLNLLQLLMHCDICPIVLRTCFCNTSFYHYHLRLDSNSLEIQQKRFVSHRICYLHFFLNNILQSHKYCLFHKTYQWCNILLCAGFHSLATLMPFLSSNRRYLNNLIHNILKRLLLERLHKLTVCSQLLIKIMLFCSRIKQYRYCCLNDRNIQCAYMC